VTCSAPPGHPPPRLPLVSVDPRTPPHQGPHRECRLPAGWRTSWSEAGARRGWRGEGAVAREAPHLTHHDGQGAGDASRYTSRLEASESPPFSQLAAVGTRPRLRRPARAKSRAAVPGARARASGAIQVQRHSVATLAFPQIRQGGRVLNQGSRGAARLLRLPVKRWKHLR
jgi:hypothetical protein